MRCLTVAQGNQEPTVGSWGELASLLRKRYITSVTFALCMYAKRATRSGGLSFCRHSPFQSSGF